MTPRARVSAALRGLPVDRVPTGPLAVHFCARLAGMSLKDYTLSAERLAAAVVAYARAFQPDAVWISADTWVTAEAMGAEVAFTADDQPLGGKGPPAARSAADVRAIPAPDVARHGRYPLMVEATRRIRDRLGEDIFLVACFDQYPFSEACALLGIDRAMIATRDERDLLNATMCKAADYAVAYGTALAEAGADMLSGGDSPAGLLGPKGYADVAAPIERSVIERLRGATGLPVSLHICGDARRLLPAMADTGADVLELDYKVNLVQAMEVCGDKVALWGNLDPVGLLQDATPQQIARETRQRIHDVAQTGFTKFVASSGCTLAVDTPRENLHAFYDAVREGTQLRSIQ